MTGNDYFDRLDDLKWCDEAGVGYFPIKDTPYDDDYFDKYVAMAGTDMGQQLTQARVELIERYSDTKDIVDIGIGSGQFMEAVDCRGYDINPKAVKKLISDGRFANPYSTYFNSATFWDSLEHIKDVHLILNHVVELAFVSIPIFDDLGHVKRSKHFRPNEHCWYFTRKGFERFIEAHGFTVLEYNTMETDLGRDGIGTFVCNRVS